MVAGLDRILACYETHEGPRLGFLTLASSVTLPNGFFFWLHARDNNEWKNCNDTYIQGTKAHLWNLIKASIVVVPIDFCFRWKVKHLFWQGWKEEKGHPAI